MLCTLHYLHFRQKQPHLSRRCNPYSPGATPPDPALSGLLLPLTLLISSKNCCFVSIFIPRNTLSIYKFCNYISIVCSILIPSAKSPSPDPKISATSGLKSIFFCTLSKHVINFLYLFYFHKNLKKIIAAETKLLFCFCCYYKNDDVLTNIFL